jgi:SWI/SNF-related matrix-associated actin-dependent regulator of chromatin subfamily A member 5
MLFLDKLLAKI